MMVRWAVAGNASKILEYLVTDGVDSTEGDGNMVNAARLLRCIPCIRRAVTEKG